LRKEEKTYYNKDGSVNLYYFLIMLINKQLEPLFNMI
jgi:hypothetical protein